MADNISKIWWPFRPKPVPPTPAPAPAPLPPQKPTLLDYARAWKILKETKLEKIWPALVSVPVLLFFTLSGIVAWLITLAGFVLRFLRLGLGG